MSATKDFKPARNPFAGTVPHGDPGKHVQQPSSGPGERERQPLPPSTTGNAADDQKPELVPHDKDRKPGNH